MQDDDVLSSLHLEFLRLLVGIRHRASEPQVRLDMM